MRSNELLALARSVRANNSPQKRDSAWDSRGTANEKLSHGQNHVGTANIESQQRFYPTVPVSHALGCGTVGHPENYGTPLGTVVGQSPYSTVLAALKSRCPELVEQTRWQQAIQNAESFLAEWGEQAENLGWTSRDLFGLAPVPDKPNANYRRLSRYDLTGLIWLLRGDPVVALTETTAAIRHATGNITTYRRFHKPAFGPLGDSLDDMAVSIREDPQ
jgi:hypothetical protein